MLPAAILAPLIGSALVLAGSSSAESHAQESSSLPTSRLLTLANEASSAGQYARAIDLYGTVVEREPQDYLSLYKRSTAYMAAGQSKKAADDLEHVLRLSKEFDSARVQLARMRLRSGDLPSAEEHLDLCSTSTSDTKNLKQSLKTADAAWKAATKAQSGKKWQVCVDKANTAIDVVSQSADLRQLRADCALEAGLYDEGIADLTRAASLNPSSPQLLLRLAFLNYLVLGTELTVATQPLKQCLHFDPDSRPCKAALRQIKGLDKDMTKARNYVESNMWSSALSLLDPAKGRDQQGLLDQLKELLSDNIDVLAPASASSSDATAKVQQLVEHSQHYVQLLEWACQAHVKSSSPAARSQGVCDLLVKHKPKSAAAALYKSSQLTKSEEYEQAVRVLQEAFEESGRSDRALMEELQKAQARLKRSKSKDYYKVLNVSPDADAKTIKRAYRKAVVKAHPDKGGSEAQMAAVNEAYEVLSNPELKARFDQGDDPNDPTGGRGPGGGNPFTGSPFSGGGGFGGKERVFQQFFQQQAGSFHGGGHRFGGSSHFRFNFG